MNIYTLYRERVGGGIVITALELLDASKDTRTYVVNVQDYRPGERYGARLHHVEVARMSYLSLNQARRAADDKSSSRAPYDRRCRRPVRTPSVG